MLFENLAIFGTGAALKCFKSSSNGDSLSPVICGSGYIECTKFHSDT